MKRKIYNLFLGLLFFASLIIPGTAHAENQISVYAAASLTGPLNEIIAAFEKEEDVTIKVNFASSGNLARQIEQGAPADIFFSASQKWMDYAQENGSIDVTTRINPIGNAIVLIAPVDNEPLEIKFTPDFSLASSFEGKFSIGDPDHVPAGKYAKQAMEALGWWPDIEPRLIRAKDVRQALMVVESGEVEVGTVFKSDAVTSEKVQMLGEFPGELHSPIIYAAALCAQRTDSEFSKKFLKYLVTQKAQEIFTQYGFQKVE